MRYVGMPAGMWALFVGSFRRQLTEALDYDSAAAAGITKKAHQEYRALIQRLPAFEKGDRFQMNIVSCAMLSAFVLSMPKRPDVDELTKYYAEGKSKPKAFWLGVLSGAVEPLFGGLTVIVAGLVVPAMPYLLSFAAGAMLYVVVEELIPEMSAGEHSNIGVLFFAVGFSLMMALDVALG